MNEINPEIKLSLDASQALAEIKRLQAQISQFHSTLAKAGADSASKVLQLQQSLITSINATGKFSASIKNIASETGAFTTALEKNKLSMGQYFKYAGGASKSFGRFFKTEMDTIHKVAVERVKDIQTQYIELGRSANGAVKSIAIRPLTLDMKNLGTQTQIAAQKQQLLNQLLKQGSTNLLNFGKNTQWAGRQLMVGFTIPLGIFGATAAKTFMQLEEQAIKFKRVYGDTMTSTKETDAMLKQIQSLASAFTQYGVAVKDTMDMAAQAAASGKVGKDLLAQVSEATRLSVLGGVEQQKSLETTISMTNAFGISADQLKSKINFLNAVENQTITNIDDLTTAIPKAAPVIKQLGGNVEDLAFFLTAMKEGGINASEGANALKSGIASLINPTNTAKKMLAGFGINITEIVQKNKGDVKNLVVDFATALDSLDPLSRARAIEQLFGKFQFSRMSTLFQNVIKQGSQAQKVLELSKSSVELGILAQKELNKISSSPMYKFQKAVEDLKVALGPVGEEFLKAVTPLINFGTDLLKMFNNLPEGIKQFTVKAVGLIAGIGPIFLMTFGLMANGLANIIKGFAFFKNTVNKATTASSVLGETTDYMTQAQIEAAAVAASLDQVHNKLQQTFTVERDAVNQLTAAYERNIAAQRAAFPPTGGKGSRKKKFASGGIFKGPGTGTSDSILARVSNGEAIIPAKSVVAHPDLVQGLIANNIPGFKDAGIVDTGSRSGKKRKPRNTRTGKALFNLLKSHSRAAPTATLRAAQNAQWATKLAEMSAGEQVLQSLLSSGAPADKILPLIAALSGTDVSHLVPQMKSHNILGQQVPLKTFGHVGIAPDSTLINQNFWSNSIEKTMNLGRSTKGKYGTDVSLVGQLARTHGKDIAKTTGIPLKNVLKHLDDFNPATGVGSMFPTTSQGQNVLAALADIISNRHMAAGNVSLGASAKAAGAMLKVRAGNKSSDSWNALASLPGFGGIFNEQNADIPSKNKLNQEIAARLKNYSNLSPKEQKIFVESVKNAVVGAEDAMVEGAKKAAQVKSPSKAAKKVGEDIAQGFIDGAKSKIDDAKSAGKGSTKGKRPRRIADESGAPGLTKQVLPDGSTQFYYQNKPIGMDEASNVINAHNKSKTSRSDAAKRGWATRRAKAGMAEVIPEKKKGFFSRPGALSSIGLGASLVSGFGGPGSDILGTVGNTLFAADMIKSLMPEKAKANILEKLSSFGGKMFSSGKIPSLKGLGPLAKVTTLFKAMTPVLSKVVLGLSGFGTAVSVGMLVFDVLNAENKKQQTISEGITELLTNNKEKLTALNDYFGTNAQVSGIRGYTLASSSKTTGKATSLAAEYGKSEQFQAAYGDTITKLTGATSKQIESSLQTMAQELVASGLGKEQTQIVVDAILQKLGSGVNIKVDNLILGTKAGNALAIENFGNFVSGYGTAVGNLDTSGMQRATTGAGSQLNALASAVQNRQIGTRDFQTTFNSIMNQVRGMPSATRSGFMSKALSGLNPELAAAISGEKNINKISSVVEAASLGVSMSPDQIQGMGSGTLKNLKVAITQAKERLNQASELNTKIEDYNNNIKDIAKQEDAINKKYNDRINALQSINDLQTRNSQIKQTKLSMAQALASGDIYSAAQALQDIRSQEAQGTIADQQKALEDQRSKEITALQNSASAMSKSAENLQKVIDGLANLEPIVLKTDKKDPKLKPGVKTVTIAGRQFPVQSYNWATERFGIDSGGSNMSTVGTHAIGGYISGAGTGTSDSIPALLSNGEYVIRAKAAKAIGIGTLDRLNHAEKFADGGKAGYGPSENPNGKGKTLYDKIVKPVLGTDKWWNPFDDEKRRKAEDKWHKALGHKKVKWFEGVAGQGGYFKTGYVDKNGYLRDRSDNHIYRDWFGFGNYQKMDSKWIKEHGVKYADGGMVDPNNPISILGTGLNSVMSGIYQNLFGGWINGLRNGKPTMPTISDAETMAFNSLPIPGKFGKLGKFFEKSSGSSSAKISLIKALITGKLLHGSTGTTAKSFKIDPFGGGQSNAFGANFFATNEPSLARFYGNPYKVKMPISQALKMKILDLTPGAKPMNKQFPGLYEKIFTDANPDFNSIEEFRGFADIAKTFGINAIRHNLGVPGDAFAFINPKNMKLVQKKNILENILEMFQKNKKLKNTPKLPTRSAMANGGMVGIPHFNNGGMFRTKYAGGGFAMLHDKEFVMNKKAVDSYGISRLSAMNNGKTYSDSVYNYNITINADGSATADDIATAVYKQINRINSQRLRSTAI